MQDLRAPSAKKESLGGGGEEETGHSFPPFGFCWSTILKAPNKLKGKELTISPHCFVRAKKARKLFARSSRHIRPAHQCGLCWLPLVVEGGGVGSHGRCRVRLGAAGCGWAPSGGRRHSEKPNTKVSTPSNEPQRRTQDTHMKKIVTHCALLFSVCSKPTQRAFASHEAETGAGTTCRGRCRSVRCRKKGQASLRTRPSRTSPWHRIGIKTVAVLGCCVRRVH